MGAMGEANHPSTAVAVMELLDRVHARLIGFARGLLGEEEDARDIVQDVVVDAWHNAQRQTPPFAHPLDEAAIRRWLFHAAYWKAVSARRPRGGVVWESLDASQEGRHVTTIPTSPGGGASGGFEQRIAESEVLQRALASLETGEAACLLLHVVQGYTSVEIGQTLQIAPDAVRKRLSRAMGRLRAAYFAQESDGQGALGSGEADPRGANVGKQVD